MNDHHFTETQTTWGRFFTLVRNDIFRFADALNFKPTKHQEVMFSAAQERVRAGVPTHIAIKSGQGVGKTTGQALIALWMTFRNFDGLSIATAPTMRQVKDVWIAGCGHLLENAPKDVNQFFDVKSTSVRIMGRKTWAIMGVSASKPENAQGWHNPNLSVFVDEASGVKQEIIETFLGTLTNPNRFMMLTGNPNLRTCAFYDCFFGPGSRLWWKYTINAEDSEIVNKENIKRLEEKFGRDSDVYRVRVLGLFPLNDPNKVISSEDVRACMAISPFEAMLINPHVRQFGLDFARYGDDASVVYRGSGDALVGYRAHYKKEPSLAIAQAFIDQKDALWSDKETTFVADADGMGQGLMHLFRGKRVHEFRSNGTPTRPDIYANAITEGWFNLRDLLKERKFSLIRNDELLQELSDREYYLTADGKLCIESKDDYRSRLKAGSPDHADACVMASYDAGMKARIS